MAGHDNADEPANMTFGLTENVSGLGYFEATGTPLCQPLADNILQPFQGNADRGLGYPRIFCCTRRPALINNHHGDAKKILINAARKLLPIRLHHKLHQ